jgi:two-component sensor histidine kinase
MISLVKYDAMVKRFGIFGTTIMLTSASIVISIIVYIVIVSFFGGISLEGILVTALIPLGATPLFVIPFISIVKEKNRMFELAEARLEVEKTASREIVHRIKNNLQVIIGIINMQIADIDNASVRNHLVDINARIQSIALIHDLLYQTAAPGSIEMTSYIPKLITMVCSSFWTGPVPVQFTYDIEQVILPTAVTIPLGLMINEIMTNAIKYGLKGSHNPELLVKLKKSGQKKLRFVMGDNGPGITPDDKQKGSGIGLRIINLLVQQLGGTMKVDSDNGVTYMIDFPV